MEWIKLSDKLPPRNVVVWIKRYPNTKESEPIYLGIRNGRPISTNPDASIDCHWCGINSNDLNDEQTSNTLKFTSSFSDITVNEWCFITPPKQK